MSTSCYEFCSRALGLDSAHLYDITKNQTYYNATVLFFTFIDSLMYNHTSGYVISSLNLASCKYPDNAVVTYKTGLYLEALSVFADATQNVTLRQL